MRGEQIKGTVAAKVARNLRRVGDNDVAHMIFSTVEMRAWLQVISSNHAVSLRGRRGSEQTGICALAEPGPDHEMLKGSAQWCNRY
jgi:hypothetical protein